MFTIRTLIGLLRLAIASYNRSGSTTREYLKLYELFRESLDALLPDPRPRNTFEPTPGLDYADGAWVLTPAEVITGATRGKLDAVKDYKNRTGQSLLYSKQTVEKFFEGHGLRFR
jgi:hypothetical protein